MVSFHRKSFLLVLVLLASVVLISGCVTQPTDLGGNNAQVHASEGKTKLVYATHWMDAIQINGTRYENGSLKSKGLSQYLDEYSALHPEIEFEIMQIVYPEYEGKLKLMNQVGVVPDIYQVYSTWGVGYQNLGIIDAVPADIKDDVKSNYASTAGVTIDGDIWGIPTEVNTYTLIYNKALFKEAGIVDASGEAKPPATWDELVSDAVKMTKNDSKGNIVVYGYAFSKDMDWGVVDPFLCLLFSNGGKYLSDDNKQCLANSTEGVQALEAILRLFREGGTDQYGDVIKGFSEGKVAMVIMPPWIEGLFRDGLKNKFDTDVGVAPVPYMKKPATLQYSWFMGVMAKSDHKKEAWDFLRWFTSEIQPGKGTTRYGDLLTDPIGAIPSRNSDIQGNSIKLGTPFKKTFVSELKNSVPEPNVLQASLIKNTLMKEIEYAWVGEKTAKQALDSACYQIDGDLSSQG